MLQRPSFPRFPRCCRSIQGPKIYVKINEVQVTLATGIQGTIKGVKGYENRRANNENSSQLEGRDVASLDEQSSGEVKVNCNFTSLIVISGPDAIVSCANLQMAPR
jgi:hypothetical protein